MYKKASAVSLSNICNDYHPMETIKQLIHENRTDEAIRLLNKHIEKNATSDEAYYLLGNAYRKKGDIRNALNNYLSALELNPDSPARVAHDQLISIMNFFNKDMFNQ